MTPDFWKFKGEKSKRWKVCVMVLLSFVAGSLITACLAHIDEASADSNRLFELRIYHTLPGKAPALELRFRNTASKLLAKHDLKVVGYWAPEGTPAWDNTFIYLVAHSDREQAKKSWDEMMADPELQQLIKSERANKLVEKIDVMY